MKKRVASSIVFMLILVILIAVNMPFIDTTLVFILSVMGIYEYNKAFKNAGFKPISWLEYVGCLSMYTMGGFIEAQDKVILIKIVIPVLIFAVFMYVILSNLKISIIDVAITVFALLYIPFMFSFIKLIMMMQGSRILVWYVFLGAFACDTFAYIIGSKFGKVKLAPVISPKKTVEGAIGGIFGTILAYVILTYIANRYFALNFNMLLIIIAGIIAGIAGQLGDLAASAIKRYCKIKDFGDIIPGHGGILDRFDSTLFVAPVIYMFFKIYMFM